MKDRYLFYSINKKNKKFFDIKITGIIGWDFSFEQFQNAIDQIPEGVERVNLYVHSQGGVVDEGYAMLTAIKRLKADHEVVAYTEGVSYSMASALVCAAHKHFMSPTSKTMIHDPWLFLDVFGKFSADDFEKLEAHIDALQDQLDSDKTLLAGVYAKKMQKTEEEVKQMFFDGADHFFTPEQAVEAGIADAVVDPENGETDEVAAMLKARTSARMKKEFRPVVAFGKKNVDNSQDFGKLNLNPYNDKEGSNSSQNTSDTMDEKELNKILGISDSANAQARFEAANAMKQRAEKAEKDLNAEKALATQLNDKVVALEARLKQDSEKLNVMNAKEFATKIQNEVESNHDNKRFNHKNQEALNALAVDYVTEEDEQRQARIEDHMKLYVQANLVPVGKDGELADASRTEASGDQSDKYAQAKAEGEQARAKYEKQNGLKN